jgi:uracil phosphoribosyltransferase
MDARQIVGSSSAVGHTTLMDANKELIIPRERTSRYLSEGDRRAILRRIEKGERQATLAKEYNVSRAAICNLYKNREEVLVRSDKDPNARHPKRQRIMKEDTIINQNKDASVEESNVSAAVGTLAQIKSERSMDDSTVDQIASDPARDDSSFDELSSNLIASRNENATKVESEEDLQELQVHELCSTSTIIKMLFSVLRDGSTKHQHFRRAADRLIHLLIEEALLSLPKRIQSIKTSDGDTCEGMFFHRVERCCAISMESTGFPLLRIFQELEPDIAIGFAAVSCTTIPVVATHPGKVIYNHQAVTSHEYTENKKLKCTLHDQEEESTIEQCEPSNTNNCDNNVEKTLTTRKMTKAKKNTHGGSRGHQGESGNSQEVTENNMLNNEETKGDVIVISQNQPHLVNVSAKSKIDIRTEFHTWRMPPPATLQLVLLFDTICGTGLEASAVIHRLIDEEKVEESKIHYVTILSSVEGLRHIQKHFPGKIHILIGG